jgi:hypothetical protein
MKPMEEKFVMAMEPRKQLNREGEGKPFSCSKICAYIV